MKYPTAQATENEDECGISTRFHILLDTLPIVENTVTELFNDFIKWGDSLDPKVKYDLVERFLYLSEKVAKKSPVWSSICDAYEATEHSTKQVAIDAMREAIKTIEGGLGWIYYIVYDDAKIPIH